MSLAVGESCLAALLSLGLSSSLPIDVSDSVNAGRRVGHAPQHAQHERHASDRSTQSKREQPVNTDGNHSFAGLQRPSDCLPLACLGGFSGRLSAMEAPHWNFSQTRPVLSIPLGIFLTYIAHVCLWESHPFDELLVRCARWRGARQTDARQRAVQNARPETDP